METPSLPPKSDARRLRQFAVGWLGFFLAMGAWQFWARLRGGPALACGVMALVGPVLCRLAPAIFGRVYWGAMWLAFPLGWLSSQLALAVMFYGVITPMALVFRIGGRDRLGRRRRTELESHWAPRARPTDVRRYFRTY